MPCVDSKGEDENKDERNPPVASSSSLLGPSIRIFRPSFDCSKDNGSGGKGSSNTGVALLSADEFLRTVLGGMYDPSDKDLVWNWILGRGVPMP